MAGLIESLLIKIGINAGEAQAGLKTVQAGMAQTAHAAQTLDSRVSGLASGIKSMLGPLAGMFAAGKLFGNYIDLADELGDLAGFTRTSVKELDAWSKATEAAGGNAERFRRAMREWTRETGKSGEDFIALGESTRNMSAEQAAATLKSMHLTSQAGEIFMQSKEKADLLVESFRASAFTDEDAENARKFRVAWQRVAASIQGIANVFIREAMPAIMAFSEGFAKVTGFFAQHTGLIKGALLALSPVFLRVFSGPILKAIQAFLAVLRLVNLPLAAIAAAVTAVVLAFEDLAGFIRGDNSLFNELLKEAGLTGEEIERVRAVFADFFGTLGSLGEICEQAGAKLAEVCGPAAQATVKTVAKWVEMLVTGFVALRTGSEDAKRAFEVLFSTTYIKQFWDGLVKFGDALGEVFDAVCRGIGASFKQAAADAKAAFLGTIESVTGWFSRISKLCRDAFVGIVSEAASMAESVWARVAGAVKAGLKALLPAWAVTLLEKVWGSNPAPDQAANAATMTPAEAMPAANREVAGAVANSTSNNAVTNTDNSRHETTITVDARGATDPQAVGEAVGGAVNRAQKYEFAGQTGVRFGGAD